jgi:hypothetical protein
MRSRPRYYTAEMAAKGLTECWREAMAAKPSTWKLMGVACGPREVDPNIHSPEEWCAWARGPKASGSKGRCTGPQDALLELTVKLRELSSKG